MKGSAKYSHSESEHEREGRHIRSMIRKVFALLFELSPIELDCDGQFIISSVLFLLINPFTGDEDRKCMHNDYPRQLEQDPRRQT